WLVAHAALAWLLLSPALLALLRTRTPAQWVALGERLPRAQGAIKLLRAAGVDPAAAVAGAQQLLTGQVPRSPDAQRVADLAARVLALEAQLQHARRVARVPPAPGATILPPPPPTT